MDIENVENLIDYVFSEEKGDFSLTPSLKEFKKLKRIMHIMVRFYEKGTESKKTQRDNVIAELEKLEVDQKMIKEQMEALEQFPPFHPKKQTYDEELERELESLIERKKAMEEEKNRLDTLHQWSKGIVKAVTWLEHSLEDYCNHQYGTNLDISPLSKVSDEEYKAYKKGLDEITFNLQESQDFFDASIDGRLQKFHQIEKCMIEAQLQVLRKYPEDNLRRQTVEKELLSDLEYVKGNMNVNPKVERHRERMKQIHRDFFAVLKWQREKLISMGFGKEEEKETTSNSEDVTTNQQTTSLPDKCPVTQKTGDTDDATKQQTTSLPDKCPVTQKTGDTAPTKPDFTIHKLYEEDKNPVLH
eukprot:TRINITY_DN157_c0_g1_i1.p1 TRINITY_DN157_c0_g1~~TRINITY_DN157_c0_g1_i1.p1  ORF type:complete len:358 (+),score=67.39 TRINITY_DN157_c0_g1_i1:63-1136(+)